MSLTPVGSMESSKDYEAVARRWYELYCALYETDDPEANWTPWADLSDSYKSLLKAVFMNLIAEGTIR